MKRIQTHQAQDYTSVQIDFMEGRPSRHTAISHDELLDLQIVLNTTDDVLDFLDVIS